MPSSLTRSLSTMAPGHPSPSSTPLPGTRSWDFLETRDLIGSRCTARSISAQLGGEKAAEVRSARARERQVSNDLRHVFRNSRTSGHFRRRLLGGGSGSPNSSSKESSQPPPERTARLRSISSSRPSTPVTSSGRRVFTSEIGRTRATSPPIDQELRFRGRRGSLPLKQVGELHHQLAVLPSEDVGR